MHYRNHEERDCRIVQGSLSNKPQRINLKQRHLTLIPPPEIIIFGKGQLGFTRF